MSLRSTGLSLTSLTDVQRRPQLHIGALTDLFDGNIGGLHQVVWRTGLEVGRSVAV